MEKFSLEARARVLMKSAATAPAGRAAETVYGGHEHVLRQTLIALTAGSVLSEHENPGEATVQVLGGRVRLVADATEWEGRDGDLLIVPQRGTPCTRSRTRLSCSPSPNSRRRRTTLVVQVCRSVPQAPNPQSTPRYDPAAGLASPAVVAGLSSLVDVLHGVVPERDLLGATAIGGA